MVLLRKVLNFYQASLGGWVVKWLDLKEEATVCVGSNPTPDFEDFLFFEDLFWRFFFLWRSLLKISFLWRSLLKIFFFEDLFWRFFAFEDFFWRFFSLKINFKDHVEDCFEDLFSKNKFFATKSSKDCIFSLPFLQQKVVNTAFFPFLICNKK